MSQEQVGTRWEELAEEVRRGWRDWQAAHRKATFREIEAALEERLSRMKAGLLEEAAEASPVGDLGSHGSGERPDCPECGEKLQPRGTQSREVTISGDQTVHLRRSYAVCPACGTGLFPPG